jgi:hypothetical protein
VDLQRRLVTFRETKNGTTRHIALNKAAAVARLNDLEKEPEKNVLEFLHE